MLLLSCCCQVREHKAALANYETQDMGKPIDEAEWDMVRPNGGIVEVWGCRVLGPMRAVASHLLT